MAKAWVGGGGGGGRRRPGRSCRRRIGRRWRAFESGEGDGVAFLGAGDLRRRRAHEPREAADALLDAVRIDDGRAVGEGAAQHARQRQFAAVRRVDGAEDLRERRPRVVDPEARAGVGDGRRLVAHRLQKPRHAMASGRRPHQHRHDMTFAQLARQIVEHEVLRRVDVADELLHQSVVIVGELLQHRIARVLLLLDDAGRHLDDGRGRGFAIEKARSSARSTKPVATPFSQTGIWRKSSGVRDAGCSISSVFADADVGLIDLIQEQDARQAEFLELAQDNLQRRNLARVGLAYHDRGVADRQRVAHVVDELDRSRAVEEGEPVAHVVDAADVRLDAHGVAAAPPGSNRRCWSPRGPIPVAPDAPPRARYSLKKAGFSALERSDDGDETRTGNAVLVIDSSQNPAPSSGDRCATIRGEFPRTRPELAIPRGRPRLSRSCRLPDMLARTAAPRKTVRKCDKTAGDAVGPLSRFRPLSCKGPRSKASREGEGFMVQGQPVDARRVAAALGGRSVVLVGMMGARQDVGRQAAGGETRAAVRRRRRGDRGGRAADDPRNLRAIRRGLFPRRRTTGDCAVARPAAAGAGDWRRRLHERLDA